MDGSHSHYVTRCQRFLKRSSVSCWYSDVVLYAGRLSQVFATVFQMIAVCVYVMIVVRVFLLGVLVILAADISTDSIHWSGTRTLGMTIWSVTSRLTHSC